MIEAGPNASKIVDLDDPRRPQFMETTALSKIYANRPIFKLDIDGNKKPHNPVRLWMCSPARRGISGIVHEPTGSPHPVPQGAHNTWRGPAIEPIRGDAHMPFVDHLLNHVCDGDLELFEYLLSWMADLVQRPGNKPGTAIALRGKQAAGKTIVFQYLQTILGPHALTVSQAEHLTGRFNGHLGGIVLLGAEEAFWAGEKEAAGVLKDLITSPFLTIEQKFAQPFAQSNHVHLMVTSNEDWVVPIDLNGDRRWLILDVTDEVAYGRPGAQEYWRPVIAALEDGSGPACLLDYLHRYNYDRALLRRPPMTKAKADQARHSADPVQAWWFEVLSGEVPLAAGPAGDQFGYEVDPRP